MQSTSELRTQIEALYSRRGRLHLWLFQQGRQATQTWRQFSQNRLAVFGVILIVLYALMSIAHPVLMATVWNKGVYDPQVGYDLQVFPHPSPPSARHILGTDTLGRDVLSRLLAATTPTFILALTAALVTAAVSTLSGAFSVYFKGILETIQTHLSDVFLLAPAPLIMVVIGGTIDISPVSFGLIYGLIAGLGGAAIIMRSQALSIINKPFIEASHVAGASGLQVIFRHLIPNMLPLAAVQMLVSVTGAVFADGFSTFLGLSRTRLNWGSMIYDSFTYQAINATITWNVLIPSALAISLFAAAFYMIARGVHEVAEPRLRARDHILVTPKARTSRPPQHQAPLSKTPGSASETARLETPSPIEDTAPVRAARQPLPEQVQTTEVSIPVSVVTKSAVWRAAQADLTQARQALQQGAPDQAVWHYGHLIQTKLLLPEVIRDLSLALERYPADHSLWQAFGDAHLRSGNLPQALEAYNKALRLIR